VLREVGAGETVFAQDTPHPFLYAVRQGLLKLRYLDADGNEWIKSFVHEGGFFASVAALGEGGRTSFEVVALEVSVVERLEHRLLDELASRHLAWSRALHAMTLAYAARKEARERALLTLSAQERYEAFCTEHPALTRRLPQKELARHLGVTAVGLNRIVMRVRRGS
jgi:CRP-like cAMP-binding protein